MKPAALFLLLCFPLLACAAERVADFPSALEKAKTGGQDIAVLFHGSDWCVPGRKLASQWQADSFLRAAGKDLLLVEIDRKESPATTDEALAKLNEACPVRPRSLPALALFDRDGRLVAIREGSPALDPLGRLEQAIQRAVEVRRKRDDFWKRADGMRGPQKAGALAAGLDLLGLGAGPKDVYQPVIEEIRKADPEDRSGAPIWRCWQNPSEADNSREQPLFDLGKEALFLRRQSVRGEHFRKKGQRRGGVARLLDQVGPLHEKCLGPDRAGRGLAGRAECVEDADFTGPGGIPKEPRLTIRFPSHRRGSATSGRSPTRRPSAT